MYSRIVYTDIVTGRRASMTYLPAEDAPKMAQHLADLHGKAELYRNGLILYYERRMEIKPEGGVYATGEQLDAGEAGAG